ncbi:GntR family transcriptional regulator [Rhodospirillales bacterium TMPK1]|uniref:GntR family transcriptional regulator n=2 Tax=Roseiterribacter gracilis TaxID=2812848 RepID=A0A8S8X9P2_9PROT|nr:GntR family transcriptional regulator [Rhodospirillales bacterium TMPK1]
MEAAHVGLLRATESIVAERIDHVGLEGNGRGGWSSAAFETDNSALIANVLTGLPRGAPLAQIEQAFHRAIRSGLVTPGVKMPTEAVLGSILGIAPRRAASIYAKLSNQGLLVRDGRTWHVPLAFGVPVAPPAPVAPGASEFSRVVSAALSHTVQASSLGLPLTPDDGPLDLFPLASWMRLSDRIAKMTGQSMLRAGDHGGFRPLREIVADHARRTFGINATPDRIVIAPGPQRALLLVTMALLEIGDVAWVENPGEYAHLAALAAAQARALPLPQDNEDVFAGDTKLAVVRPLDGPRGTIMQPSRWHALSRWSEEKRSWIVADYLHCELRGSRDPGHAAYLGSRTIHIGGFGGSMFPSLGCAWIVAPDAMVEPLLAMLRLWDDPVPIPTQATLAEFMSSPIYALHLEKAIAERAQRLDAFQVGYEIGGGRVEHLSPPRGSGLRIALPGVAQERRAIDACRAAGFGVQGQGSFGLSAGFAGTTAKRTEAAAEKLARLLRPFA